MGIAIAETSWSKVRKVKKNVEGVTASYKHPGQEVGS